MEFTIIWKSWLTGIIGNLRSYNTERPRVEPYLLKRLKLSYHLIYSGYSTTLFETNEQDQAEYGIRKRR